MFSSFFMLPLLAVAVIGADRTPLLFRRQTEGQCDIGYEACGVGCITLSSTCCPDGSGGCPIGTRCDMGNNGKYGCCPLGKVCVGNGGARTSTIFDDFTFSRTLPTRTPSVTGGLVSSRTPIATSTDDDTPSTTSSRTPTLRSTSALEAASTLTAESTSTPLLSSRTSRSSTTGAATTSTNQSQSSTGAADRPVGSLSSWLVAIVLPMFAL